MKKSCITTLDISFPHSHLCPSLMSPLAITHWIRSLWQHSKRTPFRVETFTQHPLSMLCLLWLKENLMYIYMYECLSVCLSKFWMKLKCQELVIHKKTGHLLLFLVSKYLSCTERATHLQGCGYVPPGPVHVLQQLNSMSVFGFGVSTSKEPVFEQGRWRGSSD